jgi:hypothetical protein
MAIIVSLKADLCKPIRAWFLWACATASFLPHRPDYHDAIQQAGTAEGRGKIGGQNSWIIESLQLHDVMVVDLRGKIENGTIVGDNLGTAVRTRTRAGLVVDGAIRDLPGLVTLTDVNFFMRDVHPTAIADETLEGINVPGPHRWCNGSSWRRGAGYANWSHLHPSASGSGSC